VQVGEELFVVEGGLVEVVVEGEFLLDCDDFKGELDRPASGETEREGELASRYLGGDPEPQDLVELVESDLGLCR